MCLDVYRILIFGMHSIHSTYVRTYVLLLGGTHSIAGCLDLRQLSFCKQLTKTFGSKCPAIEYYQQLCFAYQRIHHQVNTNSV